jgi:large subunit ribosomal protein L17
MLKNMAVSLFRHSRIETTTAKAKELKPFVEKLITKAKKGDLSSRRHVARFINDKDVLKKLFDEIAKNYAERNGGYTRVIKKGPRLSDSASMSIIELV